MAGINAITYGLSSPPAVIGPASLPLTPFTQTTPAIAGSTVSSCALSSTRTLSFSIPVEHGWAHPMYVPPLPYAPGQWVGWAPGYLGDVFASNGLTSMTMFPSAGPALNAIVFYAMPSANGVFNITVTGSDGSQTVSNVQTYRRANAGSAVGFGFYCTGTSKIVSVTINSDVDFAVGEFLYN